MGKNIAEYESRKRMLCKSLKVSYEFVSCKMCGLQHCTSGDSRELWLYCLNSARGFVHFSALKESFMRSHFPFPGWQLACSCVTPFLPPLSLSSSSLKDSTALNNIWQPHIWTALAGSLGLVEEQEACFQKEPRREQVGTAEHRASLSRTGKRGEHLILTALGLVHSRVGERSREPKTCTLILQERK